MRVRISTGAALAASAIFVMMASPSGAQTSPCPYPGSGTSCSVDVGAVTLDPAVTPIAAPVAPAAPKVAGKQQQQLPVTGSDVVYLVVGGTTLIGAGLVLTRRAKTAVV